MYKGFKVSVVNYLKMYLGKFIYLPIYEQQEITTDVTTIIQPWCKNLVIADLMTRNLEFRKVEETIMATRQIQDYEYNMIKKDKNKVKYY